jgi:hypothetical protein
MKTPAVGRSPFEVSQKEIHPQEERMGIMSDEATGEVRRFVAFLFDVAASVSDDCRKRRVLAGTTIAIRLSSRRKDDIADELRS